MFDASALDSGWGSAPGSGVGAGFLHAGRARGHGAAAPHGTFSAGTSVMVPAIQPSSVGTDRSCRRKQKQAKPCRPPPNSRPRRLFIAKPRHDAAEAGTCDADTHTSPPPADVGLAHGPAALVPLKTLPARRGRLSAECRETHLFALARAALLLCVLPSTPSKAPEPGRSPARVPALAALLGAF